MSHRRPRASTSAPAYAGALVIAFLGACESVIGDAQSPSADSGSEAMPDARAPVVPDAAVAELPDAAPPDARPPCVEGEARVQDEVTLACYFYIGTPTAWVAAQAACEAAGAHLASLTSLAENALASGIVVGQEPWIGANDIAAENVFTWSSGELFDFVHWRGDEPNNGGGINGEDCAVLEGGGINVPGAGFLWDDRDCTGLRDYVCERP